MLSGDVRLAGRAVRTGQTAWVDPAGRGEAGTVLSIVAADRGQQARVMVYSGRPIREEVAMGGPFVMSTRRELDQAYRDFQSGAFGHVPRQVRLTHVR